MINLNVPELGWTVLQLQFSVWLLIQKSEAGKVCGARSRHLTRQDASFGVPSQFVILGLKGSYNTFYLTQISSMNRHFSSSFKAIGL